MMKSKVTFQAWTDLVVSLVSTSMLISSIGAPSSLYLSQEDPIDNCTFGVCWWSSPFHHIETSWSKLLVHDLLSFPSYTGGFHSNSHSGSHDFISYASAKSCPVPSWRAQSIRTGVGSVPSLIFFKPDMFNVLVVTQTSINSYRSLGAMSILPYSWELSIWRYCRDSFRKILSLSAPAPYL